MLNVHKQCSRRTTEVTDDFDDGAVVEIVEGLKSGEEVVVVGRDALTPDASVNVTKWTPTKAK
jgi:hypothetical protein